jgi:lysophospholipid acyltransferase (LPLAT)-like uncharacterized protein
MFRRALQPIKYFISKAGGLLLKVRICISRNKDPDTQLAILWAFGTKCVWLFKFRQYYSNPFHINWKTVLFRRALEIVKAKHPNYKPKIHVRGGEIIADFINSKAKVVVVTIHSFISISIIRALKEFGKEAVLIAVSDEQQIAEIMGCDFKLNIIKRSKYALLQARQKLRQGNWIVCCADAPGAGGELLMVTGIFDFARKMEAQIIFAVAQVSSNGEIDIACGRTHVSEALSSSESAKEFITFLDSVLTIKKKWRICSWKQKYNL